MGAKLCPESLHKECSKRIKTTVNNSQFRSLEERLYCKDLQRIIFLVSALERIARSSTAVKVIMFSQE